MEIARAGANRIEQPRHGFQIVVEHVGPGLGHDVERAVLAQKIGRQDLDGGVGRAVPNAGDHAREMPRPAIVEIVPVHGRDHHVPQPEPRHGFRDPLRLMRVEQIGLSRGDIAERAGAGADAAQNHHGGMTLRPAFADIGA